MRHWAYISTPCLLQSCSIMGMLLDTDTHYNSHIDLRQSLPTGQ